MKVKIFNISLAFNKKKLNLKILVKSGNELYNVASSAAFLQIYVAYILFIFVKLLSF